MYFKVTHIQKTVIIFLSFLFLVALNPAYSNNNNCQKKYHLISDFDNTIKSYKSLRPLSFAHNAILRNDIYPVIDTLFKEMLAKAHKDVGSNCDDQQFFSIITASPRAMKYSANYLLRTNNFPNYEIFFKPLFGKKFAFKVKTITRVSKRVKVPVILFGDDIEKDHEIFNEYSSNNLGKVLAVYIHNIKNKALFPGQISYLTTFEIAYNEFLNGRLDLGTTLRIGEDILSAKDERIIPTYAHCPINPQIGAYPSLSPSLNVMRLKIKAHIAKICIARAVTN